MGASWLGAGHIGLGCSLVAVSVVVIVVLRYHFYLSCAGVCFIIIVIISFVLCYQGALLLVRAFLLKYCLFGLTWYLLSGAVPCAIIF